MEQGYVVESEKVSGHCKLYFQNKNFHLYTVDVGDFFNTLILHLGSDLIHH